VTSGPSPCSPKGPRWTASAAAAAWRLRLVSLDVVRPVDLAAWKENLQMTHLHGEIVIDRPPDVVFDFVADERNEPRYNPRLRRVEQISAGPIGLGTRFRAKTTTMGRATGMTIVFTGYDRPRQLASSTHLAFMDIHGELRFEPVPGGTRMQWCWEVRPRGVLRLMSPLIARMGRRQEKAVWIGLKRLLEDHGRPPPHARSTAAGAVSRQPAPGLKTRAGPGGPTGL
jgi:hypothetical protein